jgi:hypothetical protein
LRLEAASSPFKAPALPLFSASLPPGTGIAAAFCASVAALTAGAATQSAVVVAASGNGQAKSRIAAAFWGMHAA